MDYQRFGLFLRNRVRIMYTAGSNESRFGGARGRMKKSAKNAHNEKFPEVQMIRFITDPTMKTAMSMKKTNLPTSSPMKIFLMTITRKKI